MHRGVHLFRRCVKLALLGVALTAGPALAHPGGRAADGCHSCRTNCAKWGEVAGARHCHGQPSRPRQNGQPTVRQQFGAWMECPNRRLRCRNSSEVLTRMECKIILPIVGLRRKI